MNITRIFFRRLRRWISPPARPVMGELASFQPLDDRDRLALWVYKRAWAGQLQWFRCWPARHGEKS